MQTVDVRVLLNDDVDVEYFVEQLIGQSRDPGAPLGATQLVDDTSWIASVDNGCAPKRVPSRVYVRDGVVWDGSV